MTDPDGNWPTSFNRIASSAQLEALGQITLMFNYLEEGIGTIFKAVMPTDTDFSNRLYHKLNNRDRIDLLSAIAKTTCRDGVQEEIIYLLNCYEICTENRNILQHAILESADEDIISLSKKATRDPNRQNEFRIPLTELRGVADDMAELFVYTMRLQAMIDARADPSTTASLAASPDRPPKPSILIPYRDSADGQSDQPQPLESGE
ncbi:MULTISPECIES: hypothetical protein [unclassified Bradyrhizobium]|uniref:hypothetical protein n=1 Tax=unclassified Bradyrhizobium TaxID=2631580 RepID=UPI00048F558D|nr:MULTISPECIES: hypothetical protein [unclassified Bradyrhizobium]QIG95480.1 hypothetical protein G6P99_25800 [Bradyrhizobium sp. 6(2017)]